MTLQLEHPAEKHPALQTTRRELAHFDSNRDKYERRDTVQAMTRLRMTNTEISAALGITERSVERNRAFPAAPERPRLYNAAAASKERVAELERAADLTLRLAAILKEEDPTLVWGSLIRLSRRELQEIAVIALAAIPIDMTTSQLLGWVSELPAAKQAS